MHSFAILSTLSAAFAALAAAYTQPVGDPSGNAILKPGLDEVVPVGEKYTIQWDPTTEGTVTLLLLRGPSTNVVPIGAPIAEGVQNTGQYVWTPGTELEPDVLRYGIQLIVDATGQYQYSTQFGISNTDYNGNNGPDETEPPVTSALSETSAPYPTITAANSTSVYTTTTVTVSCEESTDVEPTTKYEPTGEPTYPPATTFVTYTQPPSNTTNPSKPTKTPVEPPIADDDSSAQKMFASFSMAVVAVIAAGITVL